MVNVSDKEEKVYFYYVNCNLVLTSTSEAVALCESIYYNCAVLCCHDSLLLVHRYSLLADWKGFQPIKYHFSNLGDF